MAYDNEAEKDARLEAQAAIAAQRAEEGIETEGSGTDYLDTVLAEMGEASVSYESYTLSHDDAGMVADYIEELRERLEKLEVMASAIPDKALPMLKLIARAADDFVFYFGDGDTFSDDAIQTYDILRDNVKSYNAAKKQA